jgi:hypothetical protein
MLVLVIFAEKDATERRCGKLHSHISAAFRLRAGMAAGQAG